MAKSKGTKGSGGGTPALVVLASSGVAYTQHEYQHSPGAEDYGKEASDALGVGGGRVFKTLIVEADGSLVVAMIPTSRHLSLKAVAGAVGAKRAKMAAVSDAQRATGYVVGGISPLGQRKRMRTVLDRSSLDWSTIYVSGGRRGLSVELAGRDLAQLTGAIAADIAVE